MKTRVIEIKNKFGKNTFQAQYWSCNKLLPFLGKWVDYRSEMFSKFDAEMNEFEAIRLSKKRKYDVV